MYCRWKCQLHICNKNITLFHKYNFCCFIFFLIKLLFLSIMKSHFDRNSKWTVIGDMFPLSCNLQRIHKIKWSCEASFWPFSCVYLMNNIDKMINIANLSVPFTLYFSTILCFTAVLLQKNKMVAYLLHVLFFMEKGPSQRTDVLLQI